MIKKTPSYIIGIAIPVGVGLLAAFLTRSSMDIYSSIAKPSLAPPAILFPIVWSVLYVLMGIGSAMIYNSDAPLSDKKSALKAYTAQLIFNFFWSIIFFNKRAFLSSFVWILGLLALIIVMIIRFFKVHRAAALIQIPYLLWVSFATYLNLSIYLLNK